MPAPLDPAGILQELFPGQLLNFDIEPVGPIQAAFTAVGEKIAQASNDSLLLHEQVAVQTANGFYLDLHGIAYDTLRLPNEDDEPYRARILQALTSGKLTIPALMAAVTNYYGSAYPSEHPTILVWDSQSRPDLAAVYGIVKCQFVIDITFEVSPSNYFFTTRSYTNRNTYCTDGSFGSGGGSSTTPDPNLVAIVQRYKAAAYEPVFRITRKFGNILVGAIVLGAGASIGATHHLSLNAGAVVVGGHSITLTAGAELLGQGSLTLYAGAVLLAVDEPILADGGVHAGDGILADGGTYAGSAITADGF